jgi:hypothetical protein
MIGLGDMDEGAILHNLFMRYTSDPMLIYVGACFDHIFPLHAIVKTSKLKDVHVAY